MAATPRPQDQITHCPCQTATALAVCSSEVNGRTLQLLYTLTPSGMLTGALVTDISSSEYAGER